MKRHYWITPLNMLCLACLIICFQNCSPYHSIVSDISKSSEIGAPPQLSDIEAQGKAIYEQSCLQCHGVLKDSVVRDKTAPEISLAILHVPTMSSLSSIRDNAKDLEALEVYLSSPQMCPVEPRTWSAARLTSTQIYYSLFDILGVKIDRQLLPIDGIRGSFQNNLDLQFDSGMLQIYLDLVSKSRGILVPALKTKYVSCTSTDTACLKAGFSAFAGKAFREPLSTAQVDALYNVYTQSKSVGATTDEAYEDVLTYVLASPRFLFPFERARAAGARPEPNEIANRMALFIWSSIPDAALLARAKNGSLATDAVIRSEIDRMLKDSKGERFQRTFLASWAGLRSYFATDAANGSINQSFQKETLAFLDDALRTGSSPGDLIQSNSTFVDQALANLYGIPGTYSSTPTKISLNQTPRRGLLSQGSFLSTVANATFATVYKRGNHVLKFLWCNVTPPPPPDVQPVDPNSGGNSNLSDGEIARIHRNKSASCYACHARMDPIGLSLSMFDQFGGVKPAFAPVAPDLASMPDGTVLGNPQELASYLTKGSRLQSCFVTGLSSYVYTGYKTEDVRCAKEAYHNRANSGPVAISDWVASVISDSVLNPK